MHWLARLHVVLAGVWLGTALVEALFERALLGQGTEPERILARLHRRVDMWVEIPAFTGVLLTGGMLWSVARHNLFLNIKLTFAMVAILANAYCVWLVCKRDHSASQGLWDEFRRLDHRQHQVGGVVLIALLTTLVLGLCLS